MLVHASESPEVPVNVRGTLEAAHEAINAFFMLYTLFEQEAKTWWVFSHRAFLEALCIGSVLRETANEEDGEELLSKDPLFMRGRSDIGKIFLTLLIYLDCDRRNYAREDLLTLVGCSSHGADYEQYGCR